MNARIVTAVTAALMHQGEIYLVRRQIHLTAFPGYFAFPGGKVDAEDHEGAAPPASLAGQPPELMRALARELQEEIGFDVAAAGDVVSAVQSIGQILTPPGPPMRFDTHFFRVELRQRPDFILDLSESESGAWATPADWLARYHRGEFLLAPPTLMTLQALADDPLANAISGFLKLDERSMMCIQSMHGMRQFFVRSNTLPPAMHTNCFLIGDEDAPRLLVDPSPNSREELERLLAAAGEFGYSEVFLTHHHPDHCQFADEIARRAGVPVGMSADTEARLRAKHPGFFKDIEVRIHAEGDTPTRWLGQPVRVYAVPGHDEGQLALMPDNRAWCIVGDLIQGVGTVVIAPPEGNMRKYFASLRRIIELKPNAIYPSHGIGLGSTHYLEAALRHREQREAVIHGLFGAGRSEDQILAEVYKDVDPRLLPFARINIQSHLEKLREDGAIA
jgi:glyoxylase-like metal-dependent hydrolase (beta-lactamase superfamily II)/8-oxo-dGTP pyrophosphatase MutT (NUDIX family)